MRLLGSLGALVLLAGTGCCFLFVPPFGLPDGGSPPPVGPTDAGQREPPQLDGGGPSDVVGFVEAVCHVNPQEGAPGTLVTFDGEESNGSPGATVVSWFWDFGDGADGGGYTTNHVYEDAGVFRPSLTATDSAGASGSTNCPTVTISQPGP